MKNEILVINRATAQEYEIRTETLDGQSYMVVPVVLMREGVHVGSHGAVLHKQEELAKYTEAWNGIPVTLEHPRANSNFVSANHPQILEAFGVGRIFNVHMQGDKLVGEAWVLENKLLGLSKQALDTLQANEPMDVSVGVFNDEEQVQGTWNGETYQAVAHNYRPDHLALLPNDSGACSWEDGCGIRVNLQSTSKGNIFAVEIENKNLNSNEKMKKDNVVVHLQLNEAGYREVLDSLRSIIYANDSETEQYYLEEVYPDTVVYRKETKQGVQFFKQSWTLSNSGNATLVGDAVEVKKQINYLPIQTNKEGEKLSMKKTQIDSLINANVGFTENDREWLENVPEKAFEKLQPKTIEVNKAEEISREKALEVLQLNKAEDYLALMPDDLKQQFETGLQLNEEKRKNLIQTITANAANVWEEDELNKMETPMLEKLAKTAGMTEGGTVDYSAQGGNGVQANASNDDKEGMLYPVGVEVESK